MDMNASFYLGKADAHLDHCLDCGRKVSEFEFNVNNGVCDHCPRLTTIAPAFWEVISKRAALGDLEAQKTFEVYG